MHPVSRREFLQRSGATVLASAAVLYGLGPLHVAEARAQGAGFLTAAQRSTLGAAVAQIVPASGPGDWSAADLGVVDYIDNLLSGFGFLDGATGGIYPGGPYRGSSAGVRWLLSIPAAHRGQEVGWRQQVSAWQTCTPTGWPASTRRPPATSPRLRQQRRPILHALDERARRSSARSSTTRWRARTRIPSTAATGATSVGSARVRRRRARGALLAGRPTWTRPRLAADRPTPVRGPGRLRRVRARGDRGARLGGDRATGGHVAPPTQW